MQTQNTYHVDVLDQATGEACSTQGNNTCKIDEAGISAAQESGKPGLTREEQQHFVSCDHLRIRNAIVYF